MSKIIPLEERMKQVLKLIPSSLSKKKHRELWNKELSVVDSESLLELLDSCKSVKKVISNNPNFENIADVLSWDLDSYLPGNLLAKSDIGGMLNSVEIRSPFLNPRILKFIDKEKSRPNLFGKLELKTAYQDVIPFEIITRKKRGFGLPIVKWFRYEGVQDLVKDYIESGDRKIFSFVNHDSVMKKIEQNSYLKWHMLCLSIWLEKNL